MQIVGKLQYVDVDQALKLIGGYETIYLRLIDAFMKEKKDVVDLVKANLI